MADKSIKLPRGIVEDVLVKVDKFIFPADFIILDMDEDYEIPLIFGKPFLATSKALIDVKRGKLTLKVNDEEVKFSIFHDMKSQSKTSTCHRVDVINNYIVNVHEDKMEKFQNEVYKKAKIRKETRIGIIESFLGDTLH